MISLLTDHFQPSVYYITVEAITASGRHITSSSNGVIIDTTPPEVVSSIEHFDVSFSTVIPTRFQGNNNTISARWLFRDLQSGIVEYLWAIGTRPFSVDVQMFESVGIATEAVNSNLSSVLQPNTTYYVTVIAINGAGVRSNATSGGITYVATELNRTELEVLVRVEFTEVISVVGENGMQLDILRAEREDRASVSWEGVGEDVEQTCEDMYCSCLPFVSVPLWAFFLHLPHCSSTPPLTPLPSQLHSVLLPFLPSLSSSLLPFSPPFYFPQLHSSFNPSSFPSPFFPLDSPSSLLSSPELPLFIHTVWYIGSEKQTTDILPRTEVSFNNSHSATVDSGVLYLDGTAFANISEIIALAEGKEEDPADSLFYFEPGRLLYHSVEFCNFVHRCVVTETNPSIVIRKEVHLYICCCMSSPCMNSFTALIVDGLTLLTFSFSSFSRTFFSWPFPLLYVPSLSPLHFCPLFDLSSIPTTLSSLSCHVDLSLPSLSCLLPPSPLLLQVQRTLVQH